MTGALGLLSIKSITYLTFTVFLIAAAGYLLGRITIKGINLGTAGVFIAALLYGCFFYSSLEANLVVGDVTFAKEALKIVENVGLVLFVSSVGFIAGPSFFRNLKKNYKSYVSLGLIIILAAVLVTVAVIFIGERFSSEDHESFKALVAGLLSGALTSTPAFSAAKESVGAAHEDLVAVGNGIAYLFGVIGVVLFVQLVPKIMKADMVVERQKIMADQSDEKKDDPDLIKLDDFGLCAFSVAAILGILVGCIGYKGFSLTVTGGCLLVTLVFGHFGKIGKVSIIPSVTSLKVFRELRRRCQLHPVLPSHLRHLRRHHHHPADDHRLHLLKVCHEDAAAQLPRFSDRRHDLDPGARHPHLHGRHGSRRLRVRRHLPHRPALHRHRDQADDPAPVDLWAIHLRKTARPHCARNAAFFV